MRTRLRFARWVAAAIVLGSAAQAGADLAKDSPFLAPGLLGANGAVPSGNSPELRGEMSSSEGTRYCIYDPQKKASVWVGVRETGYPFMITSADPVGDRVVLTTADGRQLSLALKESKVASQPLATAMPTLNPFPSPAGGDNAALTPELQEQERKIDAMREAMARKRMERLQALKSGALQDSPPQS
jgi:hypothetical protein